MSKQIWLYSDTHFFHFNCIKYDSLPFRDEFEMNEYIIDKWNSKINKDDFVIHLGDLFVGHDVTNEVRKFLFSRLNGIVTLIRGNHDKKEDSWYTDYIGVEKVLPFYNLGKYFFCHSPLTITDYRGNKNVEEQLTLLRQVYDELKCEYVFHGHSHNPKSLLYLNHYNCIANKHDFEPINFKEKIEELGWK